MAYEMTLDEEIYYLRWMAEWHATEAVELCEQVVSGRSCPEDMISLKNDAKQLLAWAKQASDLADNYERRRQARIRQWVRECIAMSLQPTAEERGEALH